MPPVQLNASFLPPLGIFYSFCCYSIFIAKGRFPEIFVELNLGLCDILESSILSEYTLSICL